MPILKQKLDWRSGLTELAIIVVGVLIALYADRWNERRQEAELEAHYIEALGQDLRADTAALAENAGAAADFAQHSRKLLSLLDGTSWEGTPEELARSIEFAQFLAWNYPAPLATGTIDDLRSTGNIRLIGEDVRAALGSYYRAIEQAEVWARQWQDIQLGSFSLRSEVFDADQRVMLLGEAGRNPLPAGFYQDNALPEPAGLHISEEEAAELLQRLRDAPGMKGELQNMLYVHAWVWDQLQLIRQEAVATLEVLDAYTR
jgi:hypothetical protein